MEMTSVAREMKGDSLLLSATQFQTKCSDIQLQKYPYNFMGGVFAAESGLDKVMTEFISAAEDPENYPSSNASIFVKDDDGAGGNNAYYCSYLRVGATAFSTAQKKYILRYYPVAIQHLVPMTDGTTQYIIVPGIMALVVWE